MSDRSYGRMCLTAALLGLAGCGDRLVAPDAAITWPPPAAVLTARAGDPLLASVIAPAQQTHADIPDGTSNTLVFSESLHLFASGRATGAFRLRSPHVPRLGGTFVAEHGHVECVAGAAVLSICADAAPVLTFVLRPAEPHAQAEGEAVVLKIEPLVGHLWLHRLQSAEGRDLVSFVVAGIHPAAAREDHAAGGFVVIR